MILPQTDVQSETSEVSFKQKFTIRQQDFKIILNLLRNKLYSDKIGSISREIACNARDANVENGKRDVPIVISIVEPDQLFNISTLSIVFRDFGTGMSPEKISDIYLNYGASDKRDSNEVYGGYGLGSKSPFSYTDSFSIVTIHEGVKYIYNLYIDESQQGECVLFYSEPTDEPSGTQVIIPIEHKDRYSFETLSNYWTKNWETVPQYVNFSNTPEERDKIVFDHELFYITDETSGFAVEAEGLPYDVSNKVTGSKHYNNFGIIAKVKIGEISFEASREQIEYTKQVTEFLSQRFKFINEFLLDKLLKEFESKSNNFEKYLYVCQLNNYRDLMGSVYKYNLDSLLTKNITQLKVPDIKEHAFLNPGFPSTKIENFYGIKRLPDEIYLVDCPLAKRKLVTLNNTPNTNILLLRPNKIILQEPTPNVNATERQKTYDARVAQQKLEYKEIFQNLGYTIKLLSDVPNAILPKGPAKPKSDIKEISYWKLASGKGFFKTDIFRNFINVSKSECCLLDSDNKPFDDYSVAYQVIENPGLNTISNDTELKVKCKTISNLSDVEIYFITKSNLKYFEKQMTLDEALKAIPKQRFSDFINHVYVVDYLKHKNSLIETLAKMGFGFANSIIKIASGKRFEDFRVTDLYSTEREEIIKLNPEAGKEFTSYKDELATLNEKYPLISVLLSRSLSSDDYKKVQHYIELIDNSNKKRNTNR